MVENKLIPELRFPEFKGPWYTCLLEDIAVRGSGHTPNKSYDNYYQGDIKWVSLADSKRLDNGFIYNTQYSISEEGIKNSSAVVHAKGTVILSRDAGIGKSAVMAEDMAVSQHFITWTSDDLKSNNWFLYYVLQILKPEFERIAIGSTIKTIGLPYFKKLKINVPNITEQQKIANFLIAVDKRINILQEKKSLLEKYKKGLMQKLFSQEIRFKDENGNDFPNWEESELGEVCQKQSSNISANSLETNTGKFKVYGATGYLKSVDFYREKDPYISIVKDGAGVGRILLCEAKSSVLGTLDIIKPLQNNNLHFLYFLISNVNFSRYVTGSTIPHIYFKDYSREKVLIPDPKEQKKIASFLSSIDELIEKVSFLTDRTKEFKKGLLQKMFV